MLNRRAIVILFLLIAAIASLSLVSADDSADMLSNASSDEIGIDDNNDIIESEDCEDILEDTDDGTFTSLQNKIDNAEEGSNVSLKNDYCYNTNFGKTTGMEITKSITINGNGHVIDGLSKSGLFFIHDADNVVLNNMTFKNANNAFFLSGINSYSFVNCNFLDNLDDEGVAIFSASINSSSFINCNFTHNINGNGKGGAVQLVAVGNSSFVNCSFNKNSATGEGGAIYLNQVNNSLILNCSFVNNLAYEAGGAVSLTEVNTSSILDCNFTDDYACSNRAVLLTILTGEFSEDLIIGEDSYISLSASHGGAIMLTHTNSSLIEGCKFDRNIATGTGGSIHFYDVSHSQVSSSVFGNGFATYGGNIHCEYSTLLFKDLYMIYSHCISSGSGISSIDSDFTADNCIFYYLQCKNGAGAAIYTSKGNAHITNSYFVEGLSKYGGAIAVSQGNLTVLASSFKNNYGGQGGAIYSNHGNVYVADSFFNNSYALYGSSIFSMLSNSLVVKDNTFLNPAGYAIYSLCSKGVVESGNHFEKAYHVRLTYTGYANGKEFTVRSKVLNYVLSSNGTFLESYDFEEDNGDYSELVSMDLFDKDFPENRTVYGDRDSTFTVRFKFDKHYNVENSYYEHLYIELYDDSIIQGDQIEKLDETSNIEDSMRFSMNLTANNLLFEDNDLINFFLRDATPVSVINSSSSGFTGIPSSYDSRDYGYVTPVKDQGDGGNCWAFAGIATLETCIKKITGINYDFSENNPKNLMAMDSVTGWNFEINTGGYDSMIIGYLNSWMGPVRENLDTYDIYSSLSLICHPDFHVQDIVFLPPRKNNLDNDAYKKAIMDYGAFSVGFEWSSNNYHAVSIVGWNDNYKNYDSLGTYTKGAWIFKNSWSSDWGDEGYGYLSYSTPFLSDLYSDWHAYTFKFDDYDNYLKNYQYDYSGVTDYLSNYDGSIFYENKFVCNENPDFDELLISFSTYFICPTNYTVSLYINGYRVLTQDGYSEAGYYTIPFNKIFNIENGDEFRIRIENRNEGTNYAPVCMSDETTVTSILPNTSFVSFDGEKWFDLYDLKTYGEYEFTGTRIHTCQVACIKAFTCWYYAYVVDLDVNEFSSIDVNEKITLDFTLSGKYYYINTNELIEGTLITVKINDKYYYAKISDGKAHLELSFDEPGNYSFSSGYWNDLFSSNIVEFDFVVNGNAAVNKYDTILFANSVFKEYGGSAGTVVALVDNNGNLIRDEVITFTLNGVSTRFRTNSNGQVTIPIDLAPNIYFATISYGGNDIYSSSTVQIKIVVSKATPKLAVKKKTFKKAKKVKKYTVTLKDNVGKAMKNIKLTIKVNKKTYAARTNSKGKATFKIKKLIKKGKYAATVTFNGNAYYNKVTKKVKIVVK